MAGLLLGGAVAREVAHVFLLHNFQRFAHYFCHCFRRFALEGLQCIIFQLWIMRGGGYAAYAGGGLYGLMRYLI